MTVAELIAKLRNLPQGAIAVNNAGEVLDGVSWQMGVKTVGEYGDEFYMTLVDAEVKDVETAVDLVVID